MCAKCKLQLGQHVIDNQAQSAQTSNIHQQCHHFNLDSSEISDKDAFPFQELNSKELIKIQNALRATNNLINTKSDPDIGSLNPPLSFQKRSDVKFWTFKLSFEVSWVTTKNQVQIIVNKFTQGIYSV